MTPGNGSTSAMWSTGETHASHNIKVPRTGTTKLTELNWEIVSQVFFCPQICAYTQICDGDAVMIIYLRRTL